MFVIMGATGHVGSAVAKTLLERGQSVTVVTHEPDHVAPWRDRGADIAVADVNDVASLHEALQRGRRAFLLNPPADVKLDTDAVERRTVANILAALEGLDLEKVVAQSTAGAQPGTRIGDLNVLWELEQGLLAQPIPAAINRAPYYMSNWDELLDGVRESGTLPTMLPAELELPMAAPADLGRIAADRLMSGIDDVGIRYIEGPERYAPVDVAAAFSRALNRPVEVEVTPRGQWLDAYRRLGFSDAAAESYARMTATSLDLEFDAPEAAIRGEITIERYIAELAARA